MASTSGSVSVSDDEEDFGHFSVSALGQYSDLSAGPSHHSTPGLDSHDDGYGSGDDEEEEGAWDEVDVELEGAETLARAQVERAEREAKAREINIVLGNAKQSKGKNKDKSVSTAKERMVRQQRHKTHLICHLTLGCIRNRWINDKEVQARVLSIVPAGLINAFHNFNRHTHPNERDRSRLWENAVKALLHWWADEFGVQRKGHLERVLPSLVEEKLISHPVDLEGEFGPSFKGKGKAAKQGGEVVKGPKSLSKHVRMMEGSRDMSAQLFTALCRALGLGARLVFSLQPIDWRAASAAGGAKAKKPATAEGPTKGRPGRKPGPKGGPSANEVKSAGEAPEWKDGRGEMNYKVPAIRLRRSAVAPSAGKRALTDDPLDAPPVMWTELYSPYTRQWITVDPLRRRMRCKDAMEPPRSSLSNQLLYVVAFEEDYSARDVTLRYTRSFNNYTAKMRVPSRKGTDWFAELLLPLKRKFELNRDREEDKDLGERRANEPLPTSLGAFKGHPNYALEVHLHKDEVIRPGTKQIGLFNGLHPVFPRISVVQVKSGENYYRVGRKVKEGEIPLKWVKQQVSTINKRRAEEFIKEGGGEIEKQPLFEYSQTELYVPPPVVDGKIPTNEFGNIDLFVPSMLPRGAVHLPSKLAAKCAKALGIPFAEAITGFEFRHRRATPTISGVVVAAENADALMASIFAMEEANDAKEFRKRQERCLKRWKKLIQGLRIRQRLRAAYENGTQGTMEQQAAAAEGVSQFAQRSAEKRKREEGARKKGETEVVTIEDSPEPQERPRKALKRENSPEPDPAATASLPLPVSPVPPSSNALSPIPTPPPPASTGRTLRTRAPAAPAAPAAPTPTTRATRSRTAVAAAPEAESAPARETRSRGKPLAKAESSEYALRPVMRAPTSVKQEPVGEHIPPPEGESPRKSSSGQTLKLTFNGGSEPLSRPESPAAGTPRTLRFTVNGAASPSTVPSTNGGRATRGATSASAAQKENGALRDEGKAQGREKKREVHASATPEGGIEEEESELSSADTSDLEYDSDF